MTVVHVTPGPSYVVARTDDDRLTRWCFGCRAHVHHTWALQEDPPERQPSYYDPVSLCRCDRCARDRTAFPGGASAYPSEAVWMALVHGAALTRSSAEWVARCGERVL